MYDKNNMLYIYIRNLKQALNHGLELKNVDRVIKFRKIFFHADEQRSFWKNHGKCDKT